MKSRITEASFIEIENEWIMGELYFLVLLTFFFFFVYFKYLKKLLNISPVNTSTKFTAIISVNTFESKEFLNELHSRIESARLIYQFKNTFVRQLKNSQKILRIYENSLFVHDKELFTALMDKGLENISDKLGLFHINHEDFIYCSLKLLNIQETDIRHILQLNQAELIHLEEELTLKFKLPHRSDLKNFIMKYHPENTMN